MAYMDVAPTAAANGRTVVLMHGKNFSGDYWGQTARDLAAAGFRVVVPDQIGFGKSSKPQRYQFTFQQLATNTAALLNSLGVVDVEVVGHSMGGNAGDAVRADVPEPRDAAGPDRPDRAGGLEARRAVSDGRHLVPGRARAKLRLAQAIPALQLLRRPVERAIRAAAAAAGGDDPQPRLAEDGLGPGAGLRHDFHAAGRVRVRRPEGADAAHGRHARPHRTRQEPGQPGSLRDDGPLRTSSARRRPRRSPTPSSSNSTAWATCRCWRLTTATCRRCATSWRAASSPAATEHDLP